MTPEPRVIPFGDFMEVVNERNRLSAALAVLEGRLAEIELQAPPAETLTTEIQAPRPRQGSKVDGHDATFWHKVAQENRKQIEALEERLADYEHAIRSLSELNSLGLFELREELEGRLAEMERGYESTFARAVQLQGRLARAEEALRFYGHAGNYHSPHSDDAFAFPVNQDGGERARGALRLPAREHTGDQHA